MSKFLPPKHNVIVCVHNSLEDVKRCLASLELHWNHEGLAELILVDDCSDPPTANFVQDFADSFEAAHYIRLDEQHFYTRAANVGLRFSQADFHTLLNSDTVVTRGWAKNIRHIYHQYPHVGIVGPLSNAASTQSLPVIKSRDGQTAINQLPPNLDAEAFAEITMILASDLSTPFVPIIHGFCFTMSQDVIDQIGLFDEDNFPRGYGEENDFCFRAEDAGFALAIAMDAFVFHVKSRSYNRQQQQTFSVQGQKALAEKYSERRIANTIAVMEQQPKLIVMRNRVADLWPEHEWVSTPETSEQQLSGSSTEVGNG